VGVNRVKRKPASLSVHTSNCCEFPKVLKLELQVFIIYKQK